MSQHQSVRDLVDAFSVELEALIKDEIRRGFETVLGGQAPTSRARASKAAAAPVKSDAKFARPGRKKGEKRTAAQLGAVKNALFAWIEKNPGQRIEQIGKGLSIPTKDLKRPASQLIDAKQIKTTGQKRATKYFPR
jgi:hypothetical protein